MICHEDDKTVLVEQTLQGRLLEDTGHWCACIAILYYRSTMLVDISGCQTNLFISLVGPDPLLYTKREKGLVK